MTAAMAIALYFLNYTDRPPSHDNGPQDADTDCPPSHVTGIEYAYTDRPPSHANWLIKYHCIC